MSSQSKRWVPALLVLIACSALGVSPGSAAEFKSAAQKTIVTGSRDGFSTIFKAGEFTVECKGGRVEATVVGTSNKETTVTPKLSECTGAGQAASVRTNHCASILTSETTVTTAGQSHGRVHLECSSGSKTEIEVAGLCTVSIGEQTPTHGIVYTNVEESGKKALTIHKTIKGVALTKAGPFCFLVGSEGEFSGTELLKGYTDEDDGTYLDTGKTTPGVTQEGAQVSISKE